MILALLPTLVGTYWFLGEVTAIKGSYVLVGISLAAAAFSVLRWADEVEARMDGDTNTGNGLTENPSRIGRWMTKAVVAFVLSAYLLTYIANNRLAAVMGVLLVGSMIVVYQLITVGASRAVVAQVIALFTVGPVTRFLSTGFYFHESDLLGHVRAAELLLQTGRIEAIEMAYSTYSNFPALHIVSASVSAVTGLPAYDSLILLGTFAYLIATVAIVHLVRLLLSPAEGVAAGIVFASMSVIQTYSSNLHAQAFATTIVVYLLYVVIRRDSVPQSLRLPLSAVTVMAVIGLSLVHHVTQILFAGIAAVLLAPSALSNTELGSHIRLNERAPRSLPLLLAITVGSTYLLLTRAGIGAYFIRFTSERIENPFVSDTGGKRTVFGFGTDIPYQDLVDAIASLFYVDGIYYIGLTALFVIGVVVVLTHYERYAKVSGFVLLGVLGSLFALRTPLLSTVSRLALPLAPFFSIIAGIGLLWLAESVRCRVKMSPSKRERMRHLVAAVLIAMVMITGPLVAGDDLYGLHRGPNLWETYTTPEQQVEFSAQELSELRATVQYVDRHTRTVTMLWITSEASNRFGGEKRSPATISEAGIRTNDPLVYRIKWTEHQVGSADPVSTMSIADWWLNREIGASNKIYTTGMVGMVDGQNGTQFSAARETGE